MSNNHTSQPWYDRPSELAYWIGMAFIFGMWVMAVFPGLGAVEIRKGAPFAAPVSRITVWIIVSFCVGAVICRKRLHLVASWWRIGGVLLFTLFLHDFGKVGTGSSGTRYIDIVWSVIFIAAAALVLSEVFRIGDWWGKNGTDGREVKKRGLNKIGQYSTKSSPGLCEDGVGSIVLGMGLLSGGVRNFTLKNNAPARHNDD